MPYYIAADNKKGKEQNANKFFSKVHCEFIPFGYVGLFTNKVFDSNLWSILRKY